MSKRKISISGLGYAGLPLVVAFGRSQQVIGFDINLARIASLKKNYDKNKQISAKELSSADIFFTNNPADLKLADFHIIVVPTPVNRANVPDFDTLIKASQTVGSQLKEHDIVVYESTVYPGATEEICIPALEKKSKLKFGVDFTVGYSPERINPSDKIHTLINTIKIVSGSDEATLDIIAKVYESIITAGVYRVSTIKVAEATKVIENTQRDLNISFVNEIAIILHKLNIDTQEVLEAAGTKWNFIPFRPGLVGGDCIGVDPYYLAYKAAEANCYPDMILAARRINNSMSGFIVSNTIKKLIQLKIDIHKAQIVILGLTFKENCADIRNSKVFDIVCELKNYDLNVFVSDPWADEKEVQEMYGLNLLPLEKIKDMDAIILAVAHQQYVELTKNQFEKMLKPISLIMDLKELLDAKEFANTNITLWRL